jgi:hypothetical protein
MLDFRSQTLSLARHRFARPLLRATSRSDPVTSAVERAVELDRRVGSKNVPARIVASADDAHVRAPPYVVLLVHEMVFGAWVSPPLMMSGHHEPCSPCEFRWVPRTLMLSV